MHGGFDVGASERQEVIYCKRKVQKGRILCIIVLEFLLELYFEIGEQQIAEAVRHLPGRMEYDH